MKAEEYFRKLEDLLKETKSFFALSKFMCTPFPADIDKCWKAINANTLSVDTQLSNFKYDKYLENIKQCCEVFNEIEESQTRTFEYMTVKGFQVYSNGEVEQVSEKETRVSCDQRWFSMLSLIRSIMEVWKRYLKQETETGSNDNKNLTQSEDIGKNDGITPSVIPDNKVIEDIDKLLTFKAKQEAKGQGHNLATDIFSFQKTCNGKQFYAMAIMLYDGKDNHTFVVNKRSTVKAWVNLLKETCGTRVKTDNYKRSNVKKTTEQLKDKDFSYLFR